MEVAEGRLYPSVMGETEETVLRLKLESDSSPWGLLRSRTRRSRVGGEVQATRSSLVHRSSKE